MACSYSHSRIKNYHFADPVDISNRPQMLTQWKVRIASGMQFCRQFKLLTKRMIHRAQKKNKHSLQRYKVHIYSFMLALHLFYHKMAKIKQMLPQHRIIGFEFGFEFWVCFSVTMHVLCVLIWTCLSMNRGVHVELEMKNALNVVRQVSETSSENKVNKKK